MQINGDPLPSVIGGKAYQLYRLRRFCNIPPFFTLSFSNPEEIKSPIIQKKILDYYNKSNFEFIAVRSSATVEDSVNASFAGIFETVLNVKRSNLIPAIIRVLDSVNNQRVKDYCKALNLDVNAIQMSVILQRMVDSRVSGVCFSRIQDREESILIEACYGLGEALVSGKVTPDSYFVNRRNYSIDQISVGYQKIMLRFEPDQDIAFEEEIPFHKRYARKLTDGEVRHLATKFLLIERKLEFDSADIEWAFEREELFILQARPFTGYKAL